jgi:hypothetical protein
MKSYIEEIGVLQLSNMVAIFMDRTDLDLAIFRALELTTELHSSVVMW